MGSLLGLPQSAETPDQGSTSGFGFFLYGEGRLTRIPSSDNRSTYYDIVGSSANGLGGGGDARLIARPGAGGPYSRNDPEKLGSAGVTNGLCLVGGGNDPVHASLFRELGQCNDPGSRRADHPYPAQIPGIQTG